MAGCAGLLQAMAAAMNLAVPSIARSPLHPSPTGLVWIVDAYLITFACLLIPGGALADRHGRKGALLAGLLLFTGGCALSGLARSAPLLIAGRAVAGAGAALALPVTLGVLMLLFPPAERPKAVAAWTAALAVGGALGNVAGGLALQYLPWQGLFANFGAAGAVALLACARWIPKTAKHARPLHPVGSLLLTGTIVSLLYALIEGRELGWASPRVLGAFALCAVAGWFFARSGLRRDHPLLDPRVFALPGLRAGTIGVAVAFAGAFCMFYVNAQYLTVAHHFTPAQAGCAIVPITIGMVLTSRASTGLVRRHGARRVVAAGFLALVVGLAAFSTVGPHTLYLLCVLYPSIALAGMGLALPPLSGAIMTALPAGRAGMGSGINGAAREIGSAVGVAAMGTALGANVAGAGVSAARLSGSMDHGFRVVALAVAACAVLVVRWTK
jgi:MFS family permease